MIPATFKVISGTIWNDIDEDGIKDTNEPGSENIVVSLLNEQGNVISTAMTNFAGRYNFNRTNGKYSIFVKAPIQHIFTAKGITEPGLLNSNVNELGYSDVIDLNLPSHAIVNAGYYKNTNARIEGVVWLDKNGNNLRDVTDSLMSGLLILLFDQNSNFIKSTSSGVNGRYLISGIPPGKYYVRVQELPSYSWVLFTGSNQDVDSEITNQYGSGTTRLLTLTAGNAISKFDIGFKVFGAQFVSPNVLNPKVESPISVYPNPAYWTIHIESSLKSPENYLIHDANKNVMGKGILQPGINTLDISDFSPGVYFIKRIGDKHNVTKSFIKVDY